MSDMSFVFSLQWEGRCEEAQDFYRNSRVFKLFVAAQERQVQRRRSNILKKYLK